MENDHSRTAAAAESTEKKKNRKMQDLPLRTAVAVVLIAILLCVIWFGGWIEAIVLGLFTAVAIYEMRNIFRKKGLSPFVLPLTVMGLSMFIILYKFGLLYTFALAVLAFLAVVIERIMNHKRTNDDLVASLMLFVYPIIGLTSLALCGFEKDSLSRVALFCCFAGPIMADNAAYLVGSLIGKHKLCPSISPHKTIEGALAGLIGGALGGVLAYFVQKLWGFDVEMWKLILVCFIGGGIGQFGDLLSSTFKRWAGVKDFGTIFPGHGGVMDRIDSELTAAPLVFLFFSMFVF